MFPVNIYQKHFQIFARENESQLLGTMLDVKNHVGAVLAGEAILEVDPRNEHIEDIGAVSQPVPCNNRGCVLPPSGNIIGYRHLCIDCRTYNLCGSCFAQHKAIHTEKHVFLQIPRPMWTPPGAPST